jgi:hypothetical protein
MIDTAPAAATHFRLHLSALLARLLNRLGGDLAARFSFLATYHEQLAGVDWEQRSADYTSDEHLPLRALGETCSPEALRVLLAAGLLEEDVRFGALFAALQEPLLSRRPCVGLLGWLLGDTSDIAATVRQLRDMGLLVVDNPQEARAEWVPRVPVAIWDALRGQPADAPAPGIVLQPADGFPHLEELIVPDHLHQQIMRVPRLLASDQVQTLVLRGMNGSGRRSVLGAIARRSGRLVLLCELGHLTDETRRMVGPLATLTGAMPVLRGNPAPGETLDIPAMSGYDGPLGITLGRSGGLRGVALRTALTLHLPPPDKQARARFWQASGVPIQAATLDDIAGRFLLNGGNIHRAAHLARTYAALDAREWLTPEDVREAAQSLNRQTLDTLATYLEPVDGWAELVVSELVSRELAALEARCREREMLRERAGRAFTHTLNRGVRALLSGPSGTGKTLAARALAAVLHMDLYRVDLAAVVNKYIGETERNLNEVFSRAEELDVILLLDEGDALMTQRTDVQSSNDRYANLETNYLLQRLENYEGIVLITTNASKRIDSAFLRRLDVTIEFALPDAAERRRLWEAHLPAQHTIAPALLDSVSQHCALSGGQIRNAALYATLVALNRPDGVSDDDLQEALRREYRKAGAAYPLHTRSAAPTQVERLRQFTVDMNHR